LPRQARLDAAGTLHHVIVRSIEKRQIVDDDKDRKSFVDRMGSLAWRRRRIVSRLRKRLTRNLVENFGLSLTETGRKMSVSSSAVAKVLNRRNIEVI